jgi:hypothetical protein
VSCLYSARYLLPCAAAGAFFFPLRRDSPVDDFPLDLLQPIHLELQELPIALQEFHLLFKLAYFWIHRRLLSAALHRGHRAQRRRNDLPFQTVEVGAGQPQDARGVACR